MDGAGEDIHQAPYGDHHEEADKAPEHEILTLFLHLLGVGAEDEGLERAPEEDDEGDGEEDGDKDAVDDIDNPRTEVRSVVKRLCERGERHSEGS